MATYDIKNLLQPKIAAKFSLSANAVVNGSIIDTAQYDSGIMFIKTALTFTLGGGGAVTFSIEESEDPGMAGATTLSNNNIIGFISTFTTTAADAALAVAPSIGVLNNKRYLRFVATVTGSSAPATNTELGILLVGKPLQLPPV